MESILTRTKNFIKILLAAAVMAALAALGWQWAKTSAARDAYRLRLGNLQAHYNQLADDYNLAVARSAVCEVESKDGKLTVVVRTADGRVEEHPLPYDPTHEIHFDFVCLGNRLQMRRVYDEGTPPKQGTLIQSPLAQIDWTRQADDRGLVLYRPVPEGRYALRVSGSGALTLERLDADEINELEHAPRLRRFEPVKPMQGADQNPGFMEILRALGSIAK